MTQTFAGQKIIVVGGTSVMGKAVAQLILSGGGRNTNLSRFYSPRTSTCYATRIQ